MTAPYLQPYRDAQSRHGNGFGVTLWASPASQKRRFEVFAEMIDFTDRRVLDAGCGRGDFAHWLTEHNIQYARYIGVDAVEPVLAHARDRQLPRAEFLLGDLIDHPNLLQSGDPHIVAISGALNTMDYELALRLLETAWDAAGDALIFNFLSDRVSAGATPQNLPARRLPTLQLFEWALSKTPAVCYRQDYFHHGHDGAMLMHRER